MCLCRPGVAIAGTAIAQGNPTGGVRGKVVDPDGLALPGVTVTVASPALQGQRTAVSSQNGDYLLALLPPGEYVVTYELAGFQTARRDRVVVAIAETAQIDVGMVFAGVTEVVQGTSTAGAPEISSSTASWSTRTCGGRPVTCSSRTPCRRRRSRRAASPRSSGGFRVGS